MPDCVCDCVWAFRLREPRAAQPSALALFNMWNSSPGVHRPGCQKLEPLGSLVLRTACTWFSSVTPYAWSQEMNLGCGRIMCQPKCTTIGKVIARFATTVRRCICGSWIAAKAKDVHGPCSNQEGWTKVWTFWTCYWPEHSSFGNCLKPPVHFWSTRIMTTKFTVPVQLYKLYHVVSILMLW